MTSATNGAPPLAVRFNAPAVDNAGNSIVGWTWDFGDGATSFDSNPSHMYAGIGDFRPVLIATNSQGAIVTGTGPRIFVAPGLVPTTVGTPSLSAQGFSLSVPSTVGATYALQFKNALTDPTWTSLPAIPGSGSPITLTDTNIIASARYYRVQVE